MNSRDKRSQENAAFLDNLTSFLSDEGRSIEDVKESLREQGFDPEKAIQQFRETLADHAPSWREKALRERQKAKEALGNDRTIRTRPREEIVAEIAAVTDAMRDLGAPILVGAHHRGFEQATEGDLESLLLDLKVQRDLLRQKRERSDE
jgi:DNA-binding transcriptional MerR regulator